MKHTLISLLLALTTAVMATAQVTETIPTADVVGALVCPDSIAPIASPFEGMAQLARPTFPDRRLDIRRTRGNVQRAIDQLARRGGGHVIVPAGEWTTGRITLRDNIDLHLEAGASLRFSDRIEDYLPAVLTRNEGVELYSLGALIYADHARNIAVTGPSAAERAAGCLPARLIGPGRDNEIYTRRMDGLVVEDFLDLRSPVSSRVFDGSALDLSRPCFGPKLLACDSLQALNAGCIFLPMFFGPMHCQQVLVEGVSFEEPVFWNITPVYCDSVIIRGVRVESDGGRTDGIDIESSRHVLIEYCTLACGDDCFTLKAGRAEDGLRVGRPTEDVVIRYCLAERGPGGVTIGSETAGMIRRVYMHDCVFASPSNGFYFKTRRNRGGGAEDLCFRRIRMEAPGRAFHFDMLGSPFYMGELANRLPLRAVTELTPVFRRITMEQVKIAQCRELILLKGLPESPVEDLTISHLEAHTTQRDLKVQDACGLIMTDCVIE